jgi:16S rRNA processing protein RimM
VPESQGRDRLVVGLVRGLHGLRGGLRVEVLTDDARRFARGSVLHQEGSDKPLTVTWSVVSEPGMLVRFREVPDRPAAELLRERYLEADADPDALPEGSYYWHEVVGAEVATTAGETLGTVGEVFRAGESEVFVVDGGPRGELYVPAVSAVVREFLPREGRVVVDADALGLDEEVPVPKPRGRRTTRALKAGRPLPNADGASADAPGGAPEEGEAEPEAT